MNAFFLTEKAWTQYLFWQEQDRKTLKKINALIDDIGRNPFDGTGKPEALKAKYSGWWSRRISKENRLVYKIDDANIVIAQCRYHY